MRAEKETANPKFSKAERLPFHNLSQRKFRQKLPWKMEKRPKTQIQGRKKGETATKTCTNQNIQLKIEKQQSLHWLNKINGR